MRDQRLRKMMTISIIAAILTLGAAIAPTPLPLPAGTGGIGFDDLQFAPSLGKVLVPAGRTGRLDLVDPKSELIEEIGGFSAESKYKGGHGEGITSADADGGFVFVTDRSAKLLDVVDLHEKKIAARAALASGPDYVRFVRTTREIWVTEPDAERIEVFAFHGEKNPIPSHVGFIAVPGGPESLLIDDDAGRAFTNLWAGATVAIDLKSHEAVARWPNGCRGSRGLTLDPNREFLFVGCAEGKLSVLGARNGNQLGSVSSGSGVDIIAYGAIRRHVYLPGARSATMAIIGISDAGVPTLLTTVNTAIGAHCVTADNLGKAYVCDPNRGRLLIFVDTQS